jgi:hypothetical protein
MDMVYERIFTIAGSKQVKMIVRGYYSHMQTEIQPFIEIWVKQRTEAYFSNPSELKLPKYGRFEKAEHKNIRELVVKESGISDQQFDQVMTEFKQITSSSVLF